MASKPPKFLLENERGEFEINAIKSKLQNLRPFKLFDKNQCADTFI
jgi:hypothetical protein